MALRNGPVPRALACAVVSGSMLSAYPARSFAGEVKKASADVRRSGSGASSRPAHASPSDGGDDDSGSSLASLVAPLFYYVLLSPFFVPHGLVEGASGPAVGWSVAPYPYADGAAGYFERIEPSAEDGDADAAPQRAQPPSRVLGLQVAAEGMPPLAGVGRVQLSARVLTAFRVELDSAYALYLEQPEGASSGGSEAWLGHTHLAMQFARGQNVQFRAGVGVRHWIDPTGSSLGVDFLYGVDVFWGRPITTSLEMTGGSLGHAWVAEPRGTVGVMVGQVELFGGYDGVWIGGAGPTAYLGGPVVGARAYF